MKVGLFVSDNAQRDDLVLSTVYVDVFEAVDHAPKRASTDAIGWQYSYNPVTRELEKAPLYVRNIEPVPKRPDFQMVSYRRSKPGKEEKRIVFEDRAKAKATGKETSQKRAKVSVVSNRENLVELDSSTGSYLIWMAWVIHEPELERALASNATRMKRHTDCWGLKALESLNREDSVLGTRRLLYVSKAYSEHNVQRLVNRVMAAMAYYDRSERKTVECIVQEE